MADKGATKGCKMTYKQKFPELVVRDREAIKDTIASILPKRQDIINARIEALLEDAYYRGKIDGIDDVLQDPSAYDLFSREERD